MALQGLTNWQLRKLRAIGLSLIIKSAVSVVLAWYSMTQHRSQDLLFDVLSAVAGFLIIFTFCSLIQMARSFTHSFFAGFLSFCIMTWTSNYYYSMLSESRSVVSLIMQFIYYSVFFLFDIVMLVRLFVPRWRPVEPDYSKVIHIPSVLIGFVRKDRKVTVAPENIEEEASQPLSSVDEDFAEQDSADDALPDNVYAFPNLHNIGVGAFHDTCEEASDDYDA